MAARFPGGGPLRHCWAELPEPPAPPRRTVTRPKTRMAGGSQSIRRPSVVRVIQAPCLLGGWRLDSQVGAPRFVLELLLLPSLSSLLIIIILGTFIVYLLQSTMSTCLHYPKIHTNKLNLNTFEISTNFVPTLSFSAHFSHGTSSHVICCTLYFVYYAILIKAFI